MTESVFQEDEMEVCETCGYTECECWIYSYELCACGCEKESHNTQAGRCRFCEECDGFTYDEEGTIMSLARWEEKR